MSMIERPDVADALRSHLPGIPVYTYPRYQGPIYAAIGAAIGYRTLLLVEDSREIRGFVDNIRAIADREHGRMRHAAGQVTVEFASGGTLLVRSPFGGPPVPKRVDQVIVLDAPKPVERGGSVSL
jgi:hypothetical protein